MGVSQTRYTSLSDACTKNQVGSGVSNNARQVFTENGTTNIGQYLFKSGIIRDKKTVRSGYYYFNNTAVQVNKYGEITNTQTCQTSNETFTYAYQNGSDYVRYQQIPNVFEKANSLVRDDARQMMPSDWHTWSIANFNRNKLIFSAYKIKDSQGRTLFEINDNTGAVHVSLAQNSTETARGNNHQSALADFLIKAGTYTIEFTNKASSQGIADLIIWEQHENNTFKILVGQTPGAVLNNIDNAIDVYPNQTITRTFTIQYINENNCIIKSNANGFEN